MIHITSFNKVNNNDSPYVIPQVSKCELLKVRDIIKT